MDDTKRPAKPGKKDPRAEALRANLLKRKAQSRTREGKGTDPEKPPDKAEPGHRSGR
jgi:hypothetical protein